MVPAPEVRLPDCAPSEYQRRSEGSVRTGILGSDETMKRRMLSQCHPPGGRWRRFRFSFHRAIGREQGEDNPARLPVAPPMTLQDAALRR